MELVSNPNWIREIRNYFGFITSPLEIAHEFAELRRIQAELKL